MCGITLLPLVIGLLSAGVPLAPVMAFLLSSAVTDPAMFAITVGTLGLPFAIGKTTAALGIGLLGGGITLMMVRAGRLERPTRQSNMLKSLTAGSACCSSTEVQWFFWRDPERLTVFKETCLSVAKLVVLWLGAAFVAEYFLKLYLPEESLSVFVGKDSPLAVPIAAVVGAPLYLDGYAALPFVRGLMDRGMGRRRRDGVSDCRWHHQRLGRDPGVRAVSPAGVLHLHRAGGDRVDTRGVGVRVCDGVNRAKRG